MTDGFKKNGKVWWTMKTRPFLMDSRNKAVTDGLQKLVNILLDSRNNAVTDGHKKQGSD